MENPCARGVALGQQTPGVSLSARRTWGVGCPGMNNVLCLPRPYPPDAGTTLQCENQKQRPANGPGGSGMHANVSPGESHWPRPHLLLLSLHWPPRSEAVPSPKFEGNAWRVGDSHYT